MNEEATRIAERYGITEKCQTLESALRDIAGTTSVDFDLNGFLDGIHQVIVLVGYDWHKIRGTLSFAREIMREGLQLDLQKSGDRIEDYGEHLYFVFDCGESWLKELNGDIPSEKEI